MFIRITIILLILILPSNNAHASFYDFVVGGTIKNLARIYVKTVNLPKLKAKYIKKISSMKEEKFQKYYMKFFTVYKELPPDLKQTFLFKEKITKSEVIGMIDRVNKRDLITIINKVPSDFIVKQTRHYSKPTQDLPPHATVNEMFLWRSIIQKV